MIYAGALPRPDEIPSGGRVKLVQLSRQFPDGGYRGNILYMVTSALPPMALTWAKLARRQGIKVVLNQNGVAYPAWADEATCRRINRRNQTLAKLADWVIFQSEFCRKSYAQWVGSPPASSSLLYNPIDLSRFSVPAAGERKFDILLMGSSSQPGRVRLPLEALAIAKKRGHSWKMRIAGKQLWLGASDDVQSWIRELGLGDSVELSGPYSQLDAPEIFASASILLHMQDKDASPTVPLEAMACGTPVLGLRSGGMPELVPAELGKLLPVSFSWNSFQFPPPEGIVLGAEELLQNAGSLRDKCAQYVRENFSLEQYLADHEKLFDRILNARAESAK